MVFIEPYIAALRVDPDAAVQIFALWEARVISDELAGWAWGILAGLHIGTNNFNSELSSDAASTDDRGIY